MKKKVINQKEAIEIMQKGEDIHLYTIEFNDEPIEAIETLLFGDNGIDVPEHLTYYDDSTIDYSDDPAPTEEELKKMKPVIYIPPHIPVAKEVKEYLLNSDIDFMELISELLENYYYEKVKGK